MVYQRNFIKLLFHSRESRGDVNSHDSYSSITHFPNVSSSPLENSSFYFGESLGVGAMCLEDIKRLELEVHNKIKNGN